MSRGTKQLRISKEIELRKKELEGLDFQSLETRRLEAKQNREAIEAEMEAAETDESLEAANKKAEELETEEEAINQDEEALNDKKEKLEEKIAELQEDLNDIQDLSEQERGKKEVKRGKEQKHLEERSAVNDYIRTKGQKRDGFTSVDGEAIIPVDRVTKPGREVTDEIDLVKLINVQPVKVASGSWPIMKRTTAKLNTVAELEKNPDLAKPEFIEIDYKIETYRGSIAISQESIDDSDANLVSLVEEHVGYMRVNTTNEKICNILKTFTKKTVTTVDEIKHILNVDMKTAYKKEFIMSKSFYQLVDTLKDNDGRYLFQESITSSSGYTFLGKTVHIVEDTYLGAANKASMFIGDSKAACTLFDRKQIGVRWADHHIYGQYLQAGKRMDIKKVDGDAGYYVTATELKMISTGVTAD